MKPILFNTEMVEAILDGRKTVTRRVIKPQPLCKLSFRIAGYQAREWGYPARDAWKQWEDAEYRLPENITEAERDRVWNPPCHADDILYVRETFDKIPVSPGGNFRFNERYYYKADGDLRPETWRGKWRPSIHMPKEAARLFLRVKSVWVERLHHISNEDVLSEGVIPIGKPGGCSCSQKTDGCMNEPCGNRDAYDDWCHCKAFGDLWDSTIKPADLTAYGWKANPWVWVIEFKRCKKPEATP